MKRTIQIFLVLGLMMWLSQTAQTNFPKLYSPFLGQKPLGMTSEHFATGIVSFGNFEHSSPVSTSELDVIPGQCRI